MTQPTNEGRKSNRGFASMTPEQRRKLASMGGKAAHAAGTAHEWTPAEAREAGRKGGLSTGRRGKNLETALIEAIDTIGDNTGE